MRESKSIKIDWVYIVIAYMSLMGLGFLDNLRGPFLGEISQSLNVSDTVAALIYVIPSLIAYFSSMYTPQILLRLKTIPTLRLGLVFMSLGFLGFSKMSETFHLVTSGIIFGIGFGIVSVAQNIAVSEGSYPQYRKRLFSGLHSVYALASLLAPFVINIFISQSWGRSQIYLYMSFVPLVFAISSLFIKKRTYSSFHTKNFQLNNIQKKMAHMLALSFTLYLMTEIGLASRLVLYLTRTKSLTLMNANQFLAAFFFFLFLSRLVLAFIHLKTSSIKVLTLSLVSTFFLILLGFQFSPWFFTFCGASMGPFFPTCLELISESFHEIASKVVSQVVAIGSLGVVALHYGLGLFTEYFGVMYVYYLLLVFLVGSILALLYYNILSRNSLHQSLKKELRSEVEV